MLTAGPNYFDACRACRAQSKVEAGVAAGKIGTAAAALAQLSPSVRLNENARPDGVGMPVPH